MQNIDFFLRISFIAKQQLAPFCDKVGGFILIENSVIKMLIKDESTDSSIIFNEKTRKLLHGAKFSIYVNPKEVVILRETPTPYSLPLKLKRLSWEKEARNELQHLDVNWEVAYEKEVATNYLLAYDAHAAANHPSPRTWRKYFDEEKANVTSVDDPHFESIPKSTLAPHYPEDIDDSVYGRFCADLNDSDDSETDSDDPEFVPAEATNDKDGKFRSLFQMPDIDFDQVSKIVVCDPGKRSIMTTIPFGKGVGGFNVEAMKTNLDYRKSVHDEYIRQCQSFKTEDLKMKYENLKPEFPVTYSNLKHAMPDFRKTANFEKLCFCLNYWLTVFDLMWKSLNEENGKYFIAHHRYRMARSQAMRELSLRIVGLAKFNQGVWIGKRNQDNDGKEIVKNGTLVICGDYKTTDGRGGAPIQEILRFMSQVATVMLVPEYYSSQMHFVCQGPISRNGKIGVCQGEYQNCPYVHKSLNPDANACLNLLFYGLHLIETGRFPDVRKFMFVGSKVQGQIRRRVIHHSGITEDNDMIGPIRLKRGIKYTHYERSKK